MAATNWKLDTGNDGCDESGLTGTREEVAADIMHHHDLKEWPAHWTLTPAEDRLAAIEARSRATEDRLVSMGFFG